MTGVVDNVIFILAGITIVLGPKSKYLMDVMVDVQKSLGAFGLPESVYEVKPSDGAFTSWGLVLL